MKIRFLLGHAHGGGGAIRTTLNTAGGLAALGHEVEIASVLRRWAKPRFPIPPGVTITFLTTQHPAQRPVRVLRRGLARLPLPDRVARLGRSRLIPAHDKLYGHSTLWTDLMLWRWVRRQRGGVVVGTNPGLNRLVARLARPDVVSVGQEHLNLRTRKPTSRAALRPDYQQLDALVTLTARDAADYRRFLGPGVHVTNVPNGVPDLPRPDPSAPRRPVVIAAGRLHYQKGFDLLLRAWADVAPAHPDWTLEIHGAGREHRALKKLLRSLGLTGSARLAGFTSDLPDQLRGAGVYALSSRYEGFPMVLLEAMSCGLPVVAFDCPTGPAELVEPGVNGVLVPPRSVPGLAAALRRLLADGEARAAMGRAGTAAAAGYDTASVARRWETLFGELLDRKGLPR